MSPPRPLQIFVSSPSDVAQERETCRKVVLELQRDKLRARSFRIHSFFWEDDAIPGIGADSQAVVNDSAERANDPGFACRIVVCILWTRIGTRTRYALSGTVEEVVRSLLDPTAEDARLLLYVSDRPRAPSAIDTAQLDGVRRFLEAFRLVGGLHCAITSIEQFENALRQHLRDAVDACARAPADERQRSARSAAGLPFALGDNLLDYVRSLVVEIDRLAGQAADNLRNCLELLAECGRLSMEMSAAGAQGGAPAVGQRLSGFLADVERRLHYAPLGRGAAALKAARVVIAFGGVLTDELRPLRAELIRATGGLLERQKPLIETVISFCNTVIGNWPTAVVPIRPGTLIDRIRADQASLRDLESEVQAFDALLKRAAAAATAFAAQPVPIVS